MLSDLSARLSCFALPQIVLDEAVELPESQLKAHEDQKNNLLTNVTIKTDKGNEYVADLVFLCAGAFAWVAHCS